MVPKDVPVPDDKKKKEPVRPEDEDKEDLDKPGEIELEVFEDLPEIAEEVEEGKLRPVLEEVRSLRKYPIPVYPMFIGRDKKATVCIPESEVSRKHVKVFEREGAFFVQDLGSINGTYLNDKRILDPIELKEGDRIKVSVTKQFPRGVREFIFKFNVTDEVKRQHEERKEHLAILGTPQTEADRKKILLRHCVFKVARRDLVSVFVAEGNRRVALTKLDFPRKILNFLCFVPFKAKDTLAVSVEHPRLAETIKFTVRVNTVVPAASYGAQEHLTEIIKVLDKQREIYETVIKPSSLICYLTCKLKE